MGTYQPQLTDAGLAPTGEVSAVDEYGNEVAKNVAGERPLTVYLDRREIVTLMTLGTHPEALVLGYLKNQRLLGALDDVLAVQVDWETEAAAVTTRATVTDLETRLGKRTVTTGCGQGTVFGDLMQELRETKLAPVRTRQSAIYALLKTLNDYNEIYRNAGAVHGCALCRSGEISYFVEDVGRHNAVDAIAGQAWLDASGRSGVEEQSIFYTTGRLTSEMVIKVAQMQVPVLLSRSGVTRMGLDIAREIGVTLIARARGRHFLVFSGAERIEFDAVPPVRPGTSAYHAAERT